MEYHTKPSMTPRIIIHGGAGNITRENLPPKSHNTYRDALLSILQRANTRLVSLSSASALDIATYAVTLLEQNPLFNAGKGAVYTTSGTHELEASIMVSNGYRKRGVGVMKVTRVKSPITLAREMLVRGEEDDGGGAHGHSQLHGDVCEDLAERWGLELVKPSFFWTRKRWDEHRRGLGLSSDDETYEKKKREVDEAAETITHHSPRDQVCTDDLTVGDIHWDGKEYLPQGTVGAVVLDSSGTLCVATSTGGLTNKLPGRIGDTPTLGAGFWAESWEDIQSRLPETTATSPVSHFSCLLSDCLPNLYRYVSVSDNLPFPLYGSKKRAVAMSGTGNGDSFLRVNAVRTTAAMARYSSSHLKPVSLQEAVTAVAGPRGQLQQSAGNRWGKSGEGEGGIIGIELVNGKARIVFDFNCGGMFHAWIDDFGRERFRVFHDGARPPA